MDEPNLYLEEFFAKGSPLGSKPKKEWVGLTDEEVWHMSQFNCGTRGEFARAIEAILKEKNHG